MKDFSPRLDFSGAYPNHPRIAVGAVVFHEDRVLLVQRGKPPGEGVWAIPGGRMHLGESLQEAARREILEETGILIEAKDPIHVFDSMERDIFGRVRFHYVIVDLLADFLEGDLRPGDDARDACWASREDLSRLRLSETTRQLLSLPFGFVDAASESSAVAKGLP